MAKKDEKTTNATGTGAPPGETLSAEQKSKTLKRTDKSVSKPVPELKDVDALIAARNLPRYAGESIKVFAGWKSGKAVTEEEFDAVVAAWNKRQQGTGRRA